MTLRVIGAGTGRTGTASLKLALEQLLGAPCYHMFEVSRRAGDAAAWRDAANGDPPDWREFFEGYAAVVDWPASAFWRELCEAFPDALILLSYRDPESWWKSASSTIFPSTLRASGERRDMLDALFGRRFTLDLENRDACIAAYRRHVDDVRQNAPSHRLLQWQPGDGWAPICGALGLKVPDTPFPHANTTEEFLSNRG